MELRGDFMDIWAEYEERMKQQERFRQLTIKEQLAELQNKTDKSDCIIGEIYLQKQFFELNNRQENKNISAIRQAIERKL